MPFKHLTGGKGTDRWEIVMFEDTGDQTEALRWIGAYDTLFDNYPLDEYPEDEGREVPK